MGRLITRRRGWRLLGSTTALMFDPAREPPALLAPGDRVRFVVA